MFTGIVEATGKVRQFSEAQDAWKLELETSADIARSAIGASVACNGCCLTVVKQLQDVLAFDLLDETVRLTGFSGLQTGSLVNLERSLRANGELGGHFVTGHIDCMGAVRVFEPRGKNVYLRVSFPQEYAKYAVYKGSIAIDGISLTIAEAEGSELAVWLIPHTLAVTNLAECHSGKKVNLEFDLLAKYTEKLIQHHARGD